MTLYRMHDQKNTPPSPHGNRQKLTLAELFFDMKNAMDRQNLENFRIEYEKEHGKTDITKFYTCFWPEHIQAKLVNFSYDLYINGLPPFIQAYLDIRAAQEIKKGTLDNWPDSLVERYVKRNSRSSGDDRSR